MHVTRRGRKQTGDAADGGGFSRAVGAEQPEYFTGLGDEADVLHRGNIAVLLAELLHFNHFVPSE